MSNLSSSYHINGKIVKNRIVMPPMVNFGWAGEEGLVTEQHIQHYEARAKSGTGLIIIEAVCVNPEGRLAPSQLGAWSDKHIEGLKQLAGVCHKHGSLALAQIHHAGLKAHKDVVSEHIAPSDYDASGVYCRALTEIEIKNIINDFIQAAVRIKSAGFDGIELHGAHGYLISQFFSPHVNKREDAYGGSIDNRVRIAVEIIEGIRARLGNDFIIGCRMGGNEPNLEDSINIARILEKSSVDILHISAGFNTSEPLKAPENYNYNWIVFGGTQIKKNVNIPVIAVNGIKTPERANYLIEEGMADFAAIGKGMLVDAAWAEKALSGGEIIKCIDCKRCLRFTSGQLCPAVRR